MDVESDAETYAAGVNRRDEAIALAQRWAASKESLHTAVPLVILRAGPVWWLTQNGQQGL
jgi:hypothetical protein